MQLRGPGLCLDQRRPQGDREMGWPCTAARALPILWAAEGGHDQTPGAGAHPAGPAPPDPGGGGGQGGQQSSSRGARAPRQGGSGLTMRLSLLKAALPARSARLERPRGQRAHAQSPG